MQLFCAQLRNLKHTANSIPTYFFDIITMYWNMYLKQNLILCKLLLNSIFRVIVIILYPWKYSWNNIQFNHEMCRVHKVVLRYCWSILSSRFTFHQAWICEKEYDDFMTHPLCIENILKRNIFIIILCYYFDLWYTVSYMTCNYQRILCMNNL